MSFVVAFTLLPFISIRSAPITGDSSLSSCTAGNYNVTEKQSILDIHNNLRSAIAQGRFTAKGQLMPAGSNLKQLVWDCDLETSAQQYANKCVFAHSYTQGIGENLYTAWSTAPIVKIAGSGSDASNSWADEFQDFGWSGVTLTADLFNTGVGHATQMAWANTSRIGCGATLCDNNLRVIVVCHYKSQGNILTYNIYNPGPACSGCDSTSQCSTNGLCQ